jgi:hypothetical protein
LSVAKVIIVNDKAAKKILTAACIMMEGRRYWRNYDDGK